VGWRRKLRSRIVAVEISEELGLSRKALTLVRRGLAAASATLLSTASRNPKADLKKVPSHKLALPRDFEVALHPTLALTENCLCSPYCSCFLRLTRLPELGFPPPHLLPAG
jgi:hypothetical protein